MKFTRSQLSHFLNLKNISNEEIAESLTCLGFETEIAIDFLKNNQGIKLAKIEKISKIPGKDRISLLKIKVKNDFFDVVCGAKNFQEGDFVVWASPGSFLANGMTISKRKFGKIMSFGMICSEEELKISKESEGIIVVSSFVDKDEVDWDQNPLSLIGMNECVFKTETMFSNPESKSVFGLATYLAKFLKINFKNPDPINSQQQKINFSKKTKKSENDIFQIIQFDTSRSFSNSFFFEKNKKIFKSKEEDLTRFLIDYCEIIFGIKLTLFSSKDLVKKIEVKDSLFFFNDEEKSANYLINDNIKVVIVKKTKEYSSQIHNFALCFFQNLCLSLKIFGNQNYFFSFFYEQKKPDFFEINLEKINKKIGFNLKFKDLKNLLSDKDFLIESKDFNVLKITCPPDQNIRYEADLIEEIIRFFGIKNIKERAFKIPLKEKQEHGFLIQGKMRKFLLNQGFDEVKTKILEFQAFEKSIVLKKNMKENVLRPFLIGGLLKKFVENEKKMFTIDKVFLRDQKKEIEKKHLAVLAFGDVIKSYSEDQTIKFNKDYLFAFLIKILSFFGLDSKILFQKINFKKFFFNTYLSSLDLDQKLFLEVQEVWYKDRFLAFIGEKEIWKNNKKINVCFLELDFDYFSYLEKKDKKFTISEKPSLFFRDFSLIFEEKFPPLLVVENEKKEEFLFNNYDFWIKKLKNIIPGIERVELIKIFKEKSLTFRFWLSPNLEKKTFLKLEKELRNISSVKIN